MQEYYYGDGNEVKITEYINDKQFEIDKPTATEQCFFVGEFVSDCEKLNKDGFHALSISSIQELHQMIMEQQKEIRMLKQHLNITWILFFKSIIYDKYIYIFKEEDGGEGCRSCRIKP